MEAARSVTIRPATTADAAALARLHVDVWEDAYTGLVPDRILAERRATADQRIDRWKSILTSSPAPTTLAEHDGDLIGFVCVGPPRDEDMSVDSEVWALYVRAAWWGAGVGHRLLETDLADRSACLWVLRGNERGISFYRRHGFEADGTTRTDEHGTEERMVRDGPERRRERHGIAGRPRRLRPA